jgi:FkbM family methyltransferase
MRSLLSPLQRTRRVLREGANRLLASRGMEIVHTQLERSPEKQLRLALEHFKIDTVIDVGANTGQFALGLLKDGFMGEIHSIEPLPDAHLALTDAASRHTNWFVLPAVAAGRDEQQVEIIVAGNSYSSSVLETLDRHIRAAPDSAPVGRITVQQKPLDALLVDMLPQPRRMLLKIDTQGYEYPILQGGSRCLAKAILVLLELSLQPLYRDQMLWLDMLAQMRSWSFELWSLWPEFCDPRSGQLLQINGIFARGPNVAASRSA